MIWLYGNTLTGTLSSSIGNLVKASEIRLSSNHLSGTIPWQLGGYDSFYSSSVNISQLLLDDNSFTGTIPSQLGNLPLLLNLFLKSNSLQGSVPSTFAKLTNLQYLPQYYIKRMMKECVVIIVA
jgi:hypothetical protein